MAVKLRVHPAFYRRVRHYRDRISLQEGRPKIAAKFVKASEEAVRVLLQNPGRGHSAGFESPELADILRLSLPGFAVFALFYRWDGQSLTIVTVEHCAQDLPSRLAKIASRAPEQSQ